MRAMVRTYRLLCRLYPKGYRSRYEEQIIAAAEDMLSNVNGPIERIVMMARLLFELPGSISKQYALAVQYTPANVLITRSNKLAYLNLLLIVPFFVLILLNSLLAAHISSATWHMVMYIGVVILPIVALIVGVGALAWLITLSAKRATISQRMPKFFAHNWPIASTALTALMIVGFVFGHDSVHCVTDNPAQSLQHASKTLRCVQHG